LQFASPQAWLKKKRLGESQDNAVIYKRLCESDDGEEHMLRINALKEKLSQQYPELVRLRGEVEASSAWKPADKPLAQRSAAIATATATRRGPG
jgi:hypothetical protein